jgi:hypothetical protein
VGYQEQRKVLAAGRRCFVFVVAIPGQGARRMPYCLVRGGGGHEEEEKVGVRIFYKQRGRSRGAPVTTST